MSRRPGRLELGTLVRASRQEHRLTQEELARRVGVSRSEISEIEAGRVKQPRAGLFARLCRALDLPAAALLATAGYTIAEAGGYVDEDELLLVARSLIELGTADRAWLRLRLQELRELVVVRRSRRGRARSAPARAR